MIAPIECSPTQLQANFPLLRQLYDSLTEEIYPRYLQDMVAMGYRQVGIFIEGNCIAVAGFHTATHLSSGKYLYIDDLIVDSAHRGNSYGTILLDFLEKEAIRLECNYVFLDTFIENRPAHKLYHAQGFSIAAFHYIKSLNT